MCIFLICLYLFVCYVLGFWGARNDKLTTVTDNLTIALCFLASPVLVPIAIICRCDVWIVGIFEAIEYCLDKLGYFIKHWNKDKTNSK